jgi:LPXTG-motif cell wall-anchored protein
MRKLMLVVAALVVLFALPAGAAAQSNSGIGQYEEAPPGTDPTGGDPGDPSGAPTDPATAGDSGVAGISGSSGSGTGSGSLTERQAAAAGETPSGQLPATGFDDTLALALVGASLLVVGVVLRRRLEAH